MSNQYMRGGRMLVRGRIERAASPANLADVAEHIDSAHESHRDARRAHGEAQVSLSTIGDKLKDAQAALAAGDHAKAKRCLGGASSELDAAQGHHAAIGDAHRAIGRCLTSAKRSLEKAAVAAAPGDGHDELANPTAAQGAQTSGGQQPRSHDPEIRREQDQLTSCEIAYNTRLRQMRGLR